ncbi:MAG: winged helix-turn-helix transcriptional regulator, partial [Deltaproteobacteria bacterium]|nr:winged helix-turn-helix transcriptional regulator [Deltaproteobacteria bacterium]
MDTTSPNDSLSAALFGKTRRAVLSLLYSHADEAFYLRQLARAAGVGLGAVQREVKRLSEAGILQRTGRGQHVYYQANPQCPLFSELRSLVVKTSGVGDVLRSALTPLSSRVRVAFIYGSVARRTERRDSDVDVMVVGDVTFGEVVSALRPAQETLGREINPTVYPPGEFRSKLRANHHFLKSVVRETRLFLIGDEREL